MGLGTQALKRLPPVRHVTTKVPEEKVKELLPMIGKGSGYTRKVASRFLQEINQKEGPLSSKFRRLNPEYVNRITPTKISNMTRVQEIMDQNLSVSGNAVYSIFAILKQLLDGNELPKSPDYARNQTTSLEKPPAIPTSFNPTSFQEYIHTITHTKYIYGKASFSNRLILRILRELLSPAHKEYSAYQKNINVYNDAIFFFSCQNDYASMQEIYLLIYQSNLLPNTRTINYFLEYVGYNNTKPHGYSSPVLVVLRLVEKMKELQLVPDMATFRHIYNALPDFTAKIMVIEFLKEHSIPLNSDLLYQIIKDLLSRMLPTEAVKFFESGAEYSFKDMDNSCFNLILQRFLQQGQIKEAWDLFVKYALDKEYKSIKPHVSSLFTFVSSFAKLDRLDLAWGAANTFEKKFKVLPTIEVHHNLIKCLVKTGFHENWRQVARILYHRAFLDTRGLIQETSSYWLARARARSLIDDANGRELLRFKPVLSLEELELEKRIRSLVVWDDLEIPLQIRDDDSDYSKILDSLIRKEAAKKRRNFKTIRRAARWSLGLNEEEYTEKLAQRLEAEKIEIKPQLKSKKMKRYLKSLKHKAIIGVYQNRAQEIVYGEREMLKKKMERLHQVVSNGS